jgi:hypothetical protein
LAVLPWLSIASSQAQQPLPQESGVSGYVEVLGAYINTNSQFSTDRDNKITESLDESGKRVGKFRPLMLGLVNYTFAEKRMQLYIGVRPENVAQGQFPVEAGARHDLLNGTILRASVIPLTPFQRETWKDPFVVGERRRKTDTRSYGLKLAVENIQNSGFNLEYRWVRERIDDEESGDFLLSRQDSPLVPADLKDLERDLDEHRLTAEYAVQLKRRLRLRPILRVTRGNAQGDANSFHALTTQLGLLYFGERIQLSVNGAFTGMCYDDTHPLFDKTRRDFRLGLFTILGYKAPFGFEKFRVDWINAFFSANSNISFYESINFISAIGLGYTF